MNWYKKSKVSILSNKLAKMVTDMEINDKFDFEDNIKDLHELEYKAHKISLSQAPVHPKRKENILKIIHDKAWDYFEILRGRMKEAFEYWKNQHRIESAEIWAESVIDQTEESYSNEEEMVQDILENGLIWGQFTLEGSNIYKYVDLDIMKEIVQEDFSNDSETYEYQITKWLNKKHPDWNKNEDNPLSYFNEHFDVYDIIDYLMKNIDKEEYAQIYEIIDINSIKNAIAKELYPQYMSYWGDSVQIIIDNVDEVTEKLNDIDYNNSIREMTAAISLAMNVMHVGGNIGADYLGYGPQFLNEMRDLDVEDWDKEIIEEFAI